MRQQKHQSRTQKAQRRADEERILATANAVGTAGGIGLDDGEDVGSDESADFAECSGNGIVLPTNGSG